MRWLIAAVVLALSSGACSAATDDTTGPTTTTVSAAVAESPPTPAGESTTTTTTTTTTAAPTTAAPEATAGAAGIGDSFYPNLGNGGYDVDHYLLDLDLDPVTGDLVATTTIEATATMNLDRFNLDFIGFEITSLLVNDRPAAHERQGSELVIDLPATVPSGTSFTTTVAYAGRPQPVPSEAIAFGVGWQSTPSGHHYVVAEPDAAHSWFPNNDHPRDKATYTFRITVPDAVIAAANGTLVETVATAGGSTWVWEMRDPMASYLATIVVGDFDIVDDKASSEVAGVPVRNVLPEQLAAAPPVAVQRQGEMIAFLARLFGPFPFATYGIAVVDGFPAALEIQTLSIFGSGLERNEAVVVHELAHQWFGDAVSTGTWEDIWLNEGFASYAEWLWMEEQEGPEFLAVGITAERSRFVELTESGSLTLPPPGRPPADDLFNASVYRIGAMTLHALRLTVGDEAFFAILPTYFERHNQSTATTADFIAVAEEVSGQDLGALFDEWLYQDGIPEFPG
jgi:aminopeptidase N